MEHDRTEWPPDLTPDEARRALENVREIERQTRRAISMRGGGPIVMVWGLVWMAGYCGGHLLDGAAEGLLWMVVDIVGILATLWIVTRHSKRVRDPMGRRIGLLWLTLLVFTGLMIWLAQPLTFAQMGLLIALSMMFGYVTMGIFVDRVFLWVGIAVSALAVIGYLALPAWFELWMGLLGGGTLFASGLYIDRRWR